MAVQRREIDGPDDIQLQEIVIKRFVDVGSPKFFAAAAAGTTIGRVEYHRVLPEVGRSGASVRWTFEDAIVHSYSLEESGDRPIETVVLLAKKATQSVDNLGETDPDDGPDITLDQIANTVTPSLASFGAVDNVIDREGLYLDINGIVLSWRVRSG